jgi:peroxiredoxin
LRSIQKSLAQIEEVGIRPVAISVDAPDISKKMRTDVGYTYTFLSDPKAEAIRSHDLLHPGQGVDGQDVARPAEFLVDSTGTVRWVNMTENYWVRARPEQFIEAAKSIP